MQRYYDMGYFLIAFSIGLYVGDFYTDNDGHTPIMAELAFGVLIVAACFTVDLIREWKSKRR